MKIAKTLIYLTICFVLIGMFVLNQNGEGLEQVYTSMVNEQANYYYETQNNQNYVLVSTQTDEDTDDGSDYICNKLLESCPVPTTGSDEDSADDISEKYFEQGDPDITLPPVISGQPNQNTTSIIGNVGEPVLNQSNFTQIETGEPVLNQSNFTQIETGEPVLNQSNFTQIETGEPVLNQSNFTQIEIGLESFENTDLGFKVDYPVGWEISENTTDRYYIFTLVSPRDTDDDSIRERLVLRVNNFPTNMTLEDYSTRVRDTLENNDNFSIINFNSTLLSNNPAYAVIGIEREGNLNVDVMDNWTIKDGIVYRIVFYSDNEKSSTYIPIREKMINSFSITR